MALITIDNFIGGSRRKTSNYIDGFDPSSGKVFLKIADSQREDAEMAIDVAQEAFKNWSATDVNQRSKLLLKVADIIESRLEDFAEAESQDQGKPVWLAKTVDIPRVIYNFRSFATAVLHRRDRSTFLDGQAALSFTSKEPVGVAVLISPWNLPLYLLSFKIAPAVICGNTVVCKPSEFTSLTASMLCDVLNEAGFPPGVVNMVFGTGPKVGGTLVSDPRVRLISFTGSTETAEKIRFAAAPYPKRLSLELGGKNAAIIFDDCDFEKCIQVTLRSSFINQGEVCLCTSRIFVQKGIYEIFLQRFVEETKKLNVGDPKDPNNFIGALVSKQHYEKVKSYIDLAKHEKLKILCGEEPLLLPTSHSQGYYLRPCVVTGANDESRLMQEEIFGPVVCVNSFEDEEEVIRRANNSSYGLCVTIWTENVNKIHRLAKQLQVGTVWANCWLVRDLHVPFGGVKNSGVGREGIVQSLNFYSESKTTCIQIAT